MPDSSDCSAPTFENAMEQLQAIVHELEEGQLGLETSLARFEEGIRLLKNCYVVLEQVEQRIEILTGADAAGNPLVAPFAAEAAAAGDESATHKPGRRRPATRHTAPEPDVPPVDVPTSDTLF